MSRRVELEELGEAHVAPWVALSRAEFGDAFPSDPDHTVWKHLANPQGRSIAHHLYDGETLVGRIAYQIREFTLGGRTLRAGYLTDLLIHPDHRGLGTFVRLMRDVRTVPGLDFVYVTPNAVSGPLFRSVVRLARHYRLRVLATPLRSGALVESLLGWKRGVGTRAADTAVGWGIALGGALLGHCPPGVRVGEERPPDAALDALGRSYAPASDVAGRRDARFHDWRLGAGPVFRTRVLYCHRGEMLLGYVATRVQDYLGYRTAFLIDACFAADVDPAVIRHLRWRVLADARDAGCDLALGIFMAENPGVGRFCGFPLVRVPERHLPQAVDLWVQPIAADLTLPDDPARYPITLADLDVF